MLRISALNDSSCSEDDSQKIQLTKTKEAKEAEAFAAYNKALSHQQKGNTLHAEKLLRNLFDHPLLKEASSLVDDENQTQSLNHPGLQLLYSIQKNLASILLQRDQLKEAMAAYIEAVKIDSSEVTVWFKMGQVARELHNYPLAKICFQQALQCNPNHWPSLDNAITVTYVLGDYLMCLENISTALEKDYSYPKGLALRKQILSEQPSLESVTAELFLYCDSRLHQTFVDPEESKEYINEALKIRAKRRQLVLEHQEKELQPLRFLKPLTPFTWKNVGEQLIDLYDHAVNSDPPKSLALEVDLRDYFFLDHMAFLGEHATQDKPSKPTSALREETRRVSPLLVKKITPEDDANAAFQRAKEKSGSISSIPPSLNIKDNAKESALIRRIHGDIAQVDLPASDYPDMISKMTSDTYPQSSGHVNESINDELELDAVDMSDVPLLPEEDIDMAVLSLKDIRKGDFRPDLLLKTNVEDMSDVRSLENVLSTVIDMEMQKLYPKDFSTDHEVETAARGRDSVSSPLLDTGTSQMLDIIEADKQSVQAQYKSATISRDVSSPLEAAQYHTSVSSVSAQLNQTVLQSSTTTSAHISPPAAHTTQAHQTNPPLISNISPPPAHSAPVQTSLLPIPSLRHNFSPPPAHGAAVTSYASTSHIPNVSPQSVQHAVRASISSSIQTSLQSHPSHSSLTQPSVPAISLSPQAPLNKSPASSGATLPSAVQNLVEQPLHYSSRLSVLPTEVVHSPITTSLLSPNSSSSCPKSLSMYQNVLSSIEQSYSDSVVGSQPGCKPELPPPKSPHESLKYLQKEIVTPLKGINPLYPNSSSMSDRLITEDLAVDARGKSQQPESSTERSSHLSKPYQSPQQMRLSPHHSSPQHVPGLAQASSNRSPHHYHQDLVPSQPHNLVKSPLIRNVPSPSTIALSQIDNPVFFPHRYHTGHELYRDSLGSFPANSLSLLEAEAFLAERTADKVTGQRQVNLKRSRPPPLSRSSSLPGYYTHTPEHNLLSYLSPPPKVPCPGSPFHTSGKQSPHASGQTLGLPSSMTNLIQSSMYLPCSLPISHSDITSHPLYSGLYSRLPPSHHPFSPPTTLPPYITPPRPQKFVDSYYHHLQENIRLPPRSISQSYMDDKNEKAPNDAKILKLSSPSHTTGHHRYHSSTKSPPHSSPQLGQSQQLPPRQSQAMTQLQNLAQITQQVSSGGEIHSVSGDHSYHQKRGLVFQAMVESMLSSAGPGSRPAISQAHLMPSKGSQPEYSNSVSDAKRNKSPGGVKTQVIGAKRGPKRKVDEAGSDDWANAFKRRSTRSRNARSRKEDKSIDYQNLMKKYFPRSFLYLEQEIDSEKNDDVDMEVDIDGGGIAGVDDDTGKINREEFSSLKNLAVDQEEEVKTYIKKCLKGHGLLDLIYKFLLFLAKKYDLFWYEGITDIYMSLYVRLRKHLTVPTLFCGDDDPFTPQGLREYAAVILAWSELSLSRAVAEKGARSYLTPSKAGQTDNSASDFLGQHHNQDMMFLVSLTGRDDALDSFRGEFCVRLYWLKAKLHQLLNETADAVECFEIVSELLEDVANERGLAKSNVRVIVPNIGQDRVISLSEASRQLECLQRCKSLEDTQKLYDEARYEQVVDNLISTFTNKNLSSKSLAQRERPSQLLLLVNSLYNIKQKSECMCWAEVSLNEAIHHYKRVSAVQLRQDWAATLISLFACIDRIMDEDESILKSLKSRNIVRLAHSLVSVIEVSLDVAESITEMPINSLLPWKILYRVLRFEEINIDLNQRNSNQESTQREDDKDNKDEGDLSPSLFMLRDAHEYLGRHSWCTKDDGALLLFIMSVVEKEMEGMHEDDAEELTSVFEQCVYCLYGHPNKRGRARHLNDHNSIGVKLTWERSGPVFRHFATQSVPEFDSYKTSTVTADVENLLRRIFALVPDNLNPAQGLAAVTDYIEGISNSLPASPVMSVSKELDPYNISGLLYYLLGDFYFKNKEPAKAVKFYQLDLVINSSRLDSWAGLALAKMSQIEQKLNSTELKIEKPIHKNSEGALRCFRRAVDLEAGSCKLWLEYGSLAYRLHSHASRQIRYKNMFSISEEVLQLATSKCLDMLLVAKNSYLQASKCEADEREESWLIFYMMGKVSEKQMEDPIICLEHYKQAAACLHEEQALYPKKIQFTNPLPHLALEALEVFYRIQVCVLKLVLSGRGDERMSVLDSYVTDALEGHFARGEEKQLKMVEEDREETFASPRPAEAQTLSSHLHVYHKNPVDHEYSRHKNTSGSQSEGEDSKCVDQRNVPGGQNFDLILENISADHQIINRGTVAELNNESKSKLYGEVLNPDAQTCISGSSIAVTIGGDAANLCQDPLKEQLPTATVRVSDVGAPEEMRMEEEIDTGEPGATCTVEYEVTEKAAPDGSSSERTSKQDVDYAGGDEKRSAESKRLSQSELFSSEFSSQGMKSTNELMDSSQGNSQNNSTGDSQGSSKNDSWDNSKGYSQDNSNNESQVNSKNVSQDSSRNSSQNTSKGDHQDSSKGDSQDNVMEDDQMNSQDSMRVDESSEEDTALLSCDNEADVDTDAVDVDNEDAMSTSCQTFKDSSDTFLISSQASKPEQAGGVQRVKNVDEIIEVHAGEDVLEAASVLPVGLYRQVTQGFTPHTGNIDVSDNFMDSDSFEDKQYVLRPDESLKETPVAEDTRDVTALSKLNDQEQRIRSDEVVNKIVSASSQRNVPDHIMKADVKTDSSELSDRQKEYGDVPLKDKVIAIAEVSQDNKSDKSFPEVAHTKKEPEYFSINIQANEELIYRSGMDPTGDFKSFSKTEMGKNEIVLDSEIKDEGEKWEKESQEKSSIQVVKLPLSVSSDILKGGNVSNTQSIIETSENKSSQNLSCVNDSATVRESDMNKLPCREEKAQNAVTKDPACSQEKAQNTASKDPVCIQEKAQNAVSKDPVCSQEKAQNTLNTDPASNLENTQNTVSKDPVCSQEKAQIAVTKDPDCSQEKAQNAVTKDPDCSQEKAQNAVTKDPDCCQEKAQNSVTKDPDCSQEKAQNTVTKDPAVQKSELLGKCRLGLEICASRFQSHYKSLYRLAYLYYNTKELDKARDILLGRVDWQEHPHMPAPGLFSERKQNNFFQGLWQTRVEDIERSGCFATHVHRSVKLLLNVLCDLGDLEMLNNLHNQMRRTPESGKKYLRDAERLVLAEETYLKCIEVFQHDMQMSDNWTEEQREENLFRIYHVWVSGKGCKHIDLMTDILHRAFKIMMKGRTDVNRLTPGQAVSFCQQNFSKILTPSTPTSSTAQSKPNSQNTAEKAKDGPILSLERVDQDRPSSQQNEPIQEYVKHDDAMKTVAETQQNTAVSSPGFGTVKTVSLTSTVSRYGAGKATSVQTTLPGCSTAKTTNVTTTLPGSSTPKTLSSISTLPGLSTARTSSTVIAVPEFSATKTITTTTPAPGISTAKNTNTTTPGISTAKITNTTTPGINTAKITNTATTGISTAKITNTTTPGLSTAKSTSATTTTPGLSTAKSTSATTTLPGYSAAKSINATSAVPGFSATKTISATTLPGFSTAKTTSTPATVPGINTAKTIATPATIKKPGATATLAGVSTAKTTSAVASTASAYTSNETHQIDDDDDVIILSDSE